MTSLPDLLSRLRLAGGADELLDYDLAIGLGMWTPPRGFERTRADYPAQWSRKQHNAYQPRVAYTSSLDLSISLVEAKLPGWSIDLTIDREQTKARLAIWPEDGNDRSASVEAPTPALAVLCALCQALINNTGD